jgi:Asp/Glu/hydantoin racemase
VATREEAVRRHEEDVRSNPELMRAIKRELKDKVLGCWCDDPLLCHARTLARIADED